jgi:protein gp37
MADRSHIQWTDATWNTVTGCTRVSEGCERCYIERTPPFRINHRAFDAPGIGGSTGVLLHEDRLAMPLRWRRPRRVFVNSLADLFHDAVPTEHIAKVFATMARAEQHTFQILTKRPARMRALLADGGLALMEATGDEETALALYDTYWPLPNVWLGVSVETQQWADIRIPHLLRTEAAVRFASCEPLLGPVDLTQELPADDGKSFPGLDWVIVGGESGPDARPMHPDWARQLREQCQAANVPFFFKQWGAWAPTRWRVIGADTPYRRLVGDRLDEFGHRIEMRRTDLLLDDMARPTPAAHGGTRHTGRELDGRAWDQTPPVRTV